MVKYNIVKLLIIFIPFVILFYLTYLSFDTSTDLFNTIISLHMFTCFYLSLSIFTTYGTSDDTYKFIAKYKQLSGFDKDDWEIWYNRIWNDFTYQE